MPSPSTALNILDEGVIQIKSCLISEVTNTRLENIPNYQIAVWDVKTLFGHRGSKLRLLELFTSGPGSLSSYQAIDLSIPEFDQSDKLLSEGYVHSSHIARTNTNKHTRTQMRNL